MEWIENESGDIEHLTEEKLGVYNEVLSGQVDGLERRLRDLPFHARYRPVVVWNLRLPEIIDGPEAAREVDERVTAIEQAVHLIAAAKTADDIRAAIGPLRRASEYPHL
jgi:hypothetical protein